MVARARQAASIRQLGPVLEHRRPPTMSFMMAKLYALANEWLFVYDTTRVGEEGDYYRVDLHTIPGNDFPYTGTYGSMWIALTPAGNPVIYTSINQNPNLPAGATAGTTYRIENIDSAMPSSKAVGIASVVNSNDGLNCSAAATPLLIDVANDSQQTPVNTPVRDNWLSNDHLYDAALSSFTQPTNGSVTMNADGTYEYTPNPGFTGVDTFTYIVCDDYLGEDPKTCETATVTIFVGGVVAVDRQNSTNQNTSLNATLASAGNPSGLTYSLVGSPSVEGGSLMLGADGRYGFVPASGFSGQASFEYRVCAPDPFSDQCAEARLSINVLAPDASQTIVSDTDADTPEAPNTGINSSRGGMIGAVIVAGVIVLVLRSGLLVRRKARS